MESNLLKHVRFLTVFVKVLFTWFAMFAKTVVDDQFLHHQSLDAQSNANQQKDACIESEYKFSFLMDAFNFLVITSFQRKEDFSPAAIR